MLWAAILVILLQFSLNMEVERFTIATGNEVYTVENLKNLDRLPPFCFFVAFPLKVKGGSRSPVRVVASCPGTNRAVG